MSGQQRMADRHAADRALAEEAIARAPYHTLPPAEMERVARALLAALDREARVREYVEGHIDLSHLVIIDLLDGEATP